MFQIGNLVMEKWQVSIFNKIHNCNDCHFYPKSFIVYNVYMSSR